MNKDGIISDDAQVLVDGDVTTVWQPTLAEDTLTVYLDIPGENESAVVGSMEIATLDGFENWLPGKVDARCTLGGPTYDTLDDNAVISQSDATQTIEFETHRSCKRVKLTFSEFGNYGGESILAIGDITLITGIPTTPSAVLRWTASGDDGFDGIAS